MLSSTGMSEFLVNIASSFASTLLQFFYFYFSLQLVHEYVGSLRLYGHIWHSFSRCSTLNKSKNKQVSELGTRSLSEIHSDRMY